MDTNREEATGVRNAALTWYVCPIPDPRAWIPRPRRHSMRSPAAFRRVANIVVPLAVVTSLSVGLRQNAPLYALPWFGHDDGLFAHHARSILDGDWLGDYGQVTLIKGPGYPLFIAAAYEAHIPLKLAEHLVHLVAAAVIAVAVGRLTRSRLVGAVTFSVVALDPVYLGAQASKVTREAFYGSLSLLLVGGVLLALDLLAGVARRPGRRAWLAVAFGLAAGLALGGIAAAYYLTRDEWIWLAPAVAVAAAAGVLTWRGRGAPRGPLLAAAGVLCLAGLGTGWLAVDAVRGRNEAHYGTTVVSDLAEGEIARAYAEWQRVEAGEAVLHVPVNLAQREAVYEVSPAAAEMAPYLDGADATDWRPGCDPLASPPCDYDGAFFVWGMRNAADRAGKYDSGAETQRYFGAVADDIAAACDDGRLRCTAPGSGGLPPSDRIDPGEVAGSTWQVVQTLLSVAAGEPERTLRQDGNPPAFDDFAAPLRAVDGPEAEWFRREDDAMRRQWPVAFLTDLYRWAVRLGAPVALAGLVAGVATRAGRRHPAVLVACAAMLVAALSRVGLVALVDATTYEASDTRYVMPAVDFLLVFVVTGVWCLATVGAKLRRPAGSDAAAAWPVPDDEAAGDRGRAGAEPVTLPVTTT